MLRSFAHGCLGSDEVANRVKCFRVTNKSLLLEFVVVDTHLSGEHEYIIQQVTSAISDKDIKLFFDVAMNKLSVVSVCGSTGSRGGSQHMLQGP